jgi:hypothetical protein
VRIEAEAACRTAAAAAGKPVPSYFVETSSAYPRGCYFTSNTAWFNTHAVGAGNSYARLLCAAVTAGAPQRRRRTELPFRRAPARARADAARVLRGTRGRCAQHTAGM